MQNEIYREFYQTSMVLAGLNDRKAFFESIDPDLSHTHFLIGLQGRQIKHLEYFNWSVVIYKADASGIYDLFTPLYSSVSFDRFDDAVDAARLLEKEIRNDQLHTALLQEKIS